MNNWYKIFFTKRGIVEDNKRLNTLINKFKDDELTIICFLIGDTANRNTTLKERSFIFDYIEKLRQRK